MENEEEIKEFLAWVLPKYAETFRLLAEWDKENGE